MVKITEKGTVGVSVPLETLDTGDCFLWSEYENMAKRLYMVLPSSPDGQVLLSVICMATKYGDALPGDTLVTYVAIQEIIYEVV